MRKLFINIIVISQGFLLLTDGSVRNRFFETFAAFGKNEHNDQELAQALMFGFAFVMMAGLFKNIFCQALSVFAFTFYTCFTYNLALFHDSASLYYFCLNLFVAALACDDIVTTYIDGQNENQSKKPAKKSQPKKVEEIIMTEKTEQTEKKVSSNDTKKKSHKGKHK